MSFKRWLFEAWSDRWSYLSRGDSHTLISPPEDTSEIHKVTFVPSLTDKTKVMVYRLRPEEGLNIEPEIMDIDEAREVCRSLSKAGWQKE